MFSFSVCGGPTVFVCQDAFIDLMCFLFQKGCKVPRDKLRYCQEKVVFLGHCFSATGRHLTEGRKLAVQNMPLP
ncbi:hypothetical protein GDO81_023167 [Engystomops pustulosus]|uniref:Uncharacterized protein n=1 Tax=Engystomops pustulosus TaxID=76066 RepID=A0AAV6YQ54_ENGPU|nr:hypothetical protein GDO81_023167 [Engystomops pustulosus]